MREKKCKLEKYRPLAFTHCMDVAIGRKDDDQRMEFRRQRTPSQTAIDDQSGPSSELQHCSREVVSPPQAHSADDSGSGSLNSPDVVLFCSLEVLHGLLH